MSESHCPQCGSPVTNELPGGLCPTCLMKVARQSIDGLGPTAAMPDSIEVPTIEQIARMFPEYDALEMIGRGGMGAVYKVRQRNLDRLVALKVFLYRPDDPEFAQRFEREAKALAKLNHPAILTIHDFGRRERLHYLVMEYVDGLNLRQVSATQKLSPAEAIALVPKLCDALQYAHDAGVVHRDIKPENILLDKQGRIKIADFGLAKMTNQNQATALTRSMQVMGTLNYMAPEQRERPTEVDHRADIYSLGVVIYEMLTGELPLGRFQPPSKKVEVDIRLDDMVMRALEKEPEMRYQRAEEFKTDVESYSLSSPRIAPAQPVKNKRVFESYDYGDINEIRSTLTHRRVAIVALHFLALLTCLAAGLVFVMGSDRVGILEEDPSRMIGIMVAMAGGFLFAISHHVRVLLNVPPTDEKPEELEAFYKTNKVTAAFNILGTLLGFSTGAIFIARSYLDSDSGKMLFAGICAGVLTGLVFAVGGYVQEVFGPPKHD